MFRLGALTGSLLTHIQSIGQGFQLVTPNSGFEGLNFLITAALAYSLVGAVILSTAVRQCSKTA